MRKSRWLAVLVLAGCGCSSMNNTEKDAAGGAVAGAAAGALLTRGSPFGALVGGLFGTGVGAMIGRDQDRADHRQQVAQAIAARQMSVFDIAQMSQSHVNDSIIIQQIYATGSVYALTADDLRYLRDQHVSDQVVSVMVSRRGPMVIAPGGAVVVAPPPPPPPGPYYGPPPAVVIDPGPPPPVVGIIGVGVR